MPLVALPSVLKEDFNENLKPDIWPEVYGAERGTLSGEPLKSGTALIFKGVSGVFLIHRIYNIKYSARAFMVTDDKLQVSRRRNLI